MRSVPSPSGLVPVPLPRPGLRPMDPRVQGLALASAVALLCFCSLRVPAAEPAPPTAVDFNRDIRPILSQNCIFCHGPDEKQRKGGKRASGGFRLDTLAGQREDLGGHFGVVPGKPDQSEIIRRLAVSDGDEVMPPAKSGKKLTAEQIGLVRRWIEAGAKFSNHWSYEKPVRPPLPLVKDGTWPRNGLDSFVLARLESEGLKPQPQADVEILARRVALDLTGLPPAPEEVDRFLADNDSGAFERYVDLLLAKPAYGEHWARMWLDLARYADSAGYADDPPRTIWPYRDYVIRAFNANLPFDQFTIEQIAGDLLPDPSEDQLKATAFHRNTMTNSEGGTNDEEFRNVAMIDRVNTTFAVWMGTSMACAQCHNHKYDPISQKEYFQLFAFLNNTADADRPDEAPLLTFDTDEIRTHRAELNLGLDALDAKFRSETPNLAAAAYEWARVFGAKMEWQSPKPVSAMSGAGHAITVLDDSSVMVVPKGTNLLRDTYTIDLPFDSATTLTALRIEALTHEALGGNGPGMAGNFFVRSVRAKLLPVPNQAGPLTRFVRVELPRRGSIRLAELQVFSSGENIAKDSVPTQSSTAGEARPALAVDGKSDGALSMTQEEDQPWFEIDLRSVRPVERIVVWPGAEPGNRLEGFRVVALDEKRQTVWEQAGNSAPRKEVTFELAGPREVELVNASADYNQDNLDEALVANDAPKSARYFRKRSEKGWAVGGATGKDHVLLLGLAKPVDVPRGATLSVTIGQQSSAEKNLLGHFRIGTTSDGRAAEYVDTPPSVRAALAVGPASRDFRADDAQRDPIVAHFVRHIAPGLRDERERYARLQRERDELKPQTLPIYRELTGKDRRATRIQVRGNFLVTTDEVAEGVPAAWHPLPGNAKPDRLGLARWLVDADNPLTARVVVNRFWEQIFGIGIVRTSEEFGSQGEQPVNQDLLDWMATELVAQRWNVKAFLRVLVTSASYRQSSRVTPEVLEKDPDNRLVSRGPRFRMGAEMIRDQALAAAGLLSSRMLGPSVRPPRPSLDLRAAFGGNLDWQTSPGEDRYRRGLYTEWRRTSPYPSMATFDAPSREVCTLRRGRSNTPLQALVTLNDPVYIEAAQGLARRMIAAGATPEARVGCGFRLVLSRLPSPVELSEVTLLLSDVRADFERDPKRARALISGPAAVTAPIAGEAEVDLASWTAVANVLLNLDETLMKR